MTLLYANPQAAPPLLGAPWLGDQSPQVRRAALVPLAICLGVQWVFLVAYGIPETRALPTYAWWVGQLAPLSFTEGHRLGATLLLLSAGALFGMSRTRHWVGRTAMTVPAALGSVTIALVLVPLVLEHTMHAAALGVLLLLVWLVAAWYAAIYVVLVDLSPPPAPKRRTGSVVLAAWILLLPGPLALGRVLIARDLRAEAEALTSNTAALHLAALLTPASVRLSLFGALIGVVLWLGYQCWPRQSTSRSLRWYVALTLAFLALTDVWWTAQTSAARRVTELRYGTPATELALACATWVYPPGPGTPAETPTLTVTASGLRCATVSAFSGYHQTGTTATTVNVSPVALRPGPLGSARTVPAASSRPRTGGPGTASAARLVPLAGARYGDVLVLAGSDRVDRVADQLVAVSLRGGAPLWRFSCGTKREVRARFPGGQTDPASPNLVPGEPGAVVVLTCGTQRLRLDPVTGLSA